jgi:hypothetical protein
LCVFLIIYLKTEKFVLNSVSRQERQTKGS